jgi:protein-disulfide isomerase
VAFFPREGTQTNGAAATTGAAQAPLAADELTPDQLAEWRDWLDRQPRVSDVAPSGEVKVLLVKFNDYQCPSCRQTWAAYRDLIAKWEAAEPVAFVFETRDFPLEPECGAGGMHPGACEAAVAARLAKEQGRGKEMEAWLYQNQAELSRARIKQELESIAGVTNYDARYDAVLAEVRKDAELGERLGVSGTPTFFLNGVRMGSGVRVSYLDAAIAHELQKAQGAT